MNKTNPDNQQRPRLPSWLKRPIGSGKTFEKVRRLLDDLKLATVCDSAGCPNQGECFCRGTATFMILGEVCTRNCRFCKVRHGQVEPVVPDEPERVAEAVVRLGLRHVVVTSVTRDDLPDGGAGHFARTIEAIRRRRPEAFVEVLTPDFLGRRDCLDVVCRARPDIFNHNVETCRRLTGEIRSGADYDRSLAVLRYVAESGDPPRVKSGFMLGLGETEAEIGQLLGDLRGARVQMLTIGQYLRPGPANRPVQRFYRPEEFAELSRRAEEMGFDHVAAGPFVRSSYHAESSLKKANEKRQT